MDDDFADWKPDKVKLESELILDDCNETDTNLTASYPEASHIIPSTTFVERNTSSPETILFNSALGLPSITKPSSSMSQVAVKIKEEIIEDETSSTDPLMMDDGAQNSPKTVPSVNQGEDLVFQEKMSIKIEDNLLEENTGKVNKHPKLDFTGAKEEMKVEGTSDFSDFSADCRSKGKSFESTADGDVIAQKSSNRMEECGVKSCKLISPLEQFNSDTHTTSVCSNGSTKHTLPDYSEAASSKKEFSTKQHEGLINSSTAVDECTPSQSDRIPFEFVDSSATIKKEVATDSDVSVDENTSSTRVMQISPSTPASTERQASSSQKKLSCKQCAAQFTRKYSLRMHLLSHSGERPLSCDKCSAQFSRKCHLKRHLLTHSKVRAFSCNQCSAQFKRESDLRRHLSNHTNQRAFFCDQCSAQFNRKAVLKQHLLTHSDVKAFTCDQCFAQFKRKSGLQKHLSSHSDERAFSCDRCSAQYKDKFKLRKHFLTHSNEAAFSRDECSAQFNRNNSLYITSTHSDDRTFSCEQCSARFKSKSHLRTHSLTHSNQRTFSCDQCSARFNRKSILNQHLSTHSSKKAFACDQCSAQFTRKYTLKMHTTSAHSNERVFPIE